MPQFRPSQFPVGDSLALQNPAVPGVSNVFVGNGVKGDRGDPGPAPAGTGIVTVVDGVLQTPKSLADIGAQPAGNYQPVGDYVLGNDPRLTDPRPPTSHDHDGLYYRKNTALALSIALG